MRPEDTWRLSFDFSYKYGDKLIYKDDIQYERQKQLGVKNLWTRFNLGVEYGVTDQLTLGLNVPFVLNYREEQKSKVYYEAHGLGDVSFHGRYWFLDLDEELNAYVEAGVGFPTGRDDETYAFQKYKKAYIQAGSGQWAPTAGVGLKWTTGDFMVSGSAGYVWTVGENDAVSFTNPNVDRAGYDSADALFASVGAGWTALRAGESDEVLFGPSLFFTGTFIPGFDVRDGVRVANTGGDWISVVPGLFFSPDGGKLVISVSAAVPLIIDVHSLQCAETASYMFGVSYRF